MKKTTRITRTIGGAHGARCADLLAAIGEYVEGSIDPALCRKLEAHLAKCNPCRVVVDNVRKTITLYRREKPCRLPLAFRKRLHACLKEHWKKPRRG